MNQDCKIPDVDKIPIHFRFGTFLGVISSITGIAIALGIGWAMVKNLDKTFEDKLPLINKIPVIEFQQSEMGKRLDKIDSNIQLLTDRLIYNKK